MDGSTGSRGMALRDCIAERALHETDCLIDCAGIHLGCDLRSVCSVQEQFIGGNAPRVDIGAIIDGFTLQLLERHIGRRAGDLRKFLWLSGHHLGGVKIQQARVAVERDYDVLRLVTEVDPPAIMQMGQAGRSDAREEPKLFYLFTASMPPNVSASHTLDIFLSFKSLFKKPASFNRPLVFDAPLSQSIREQLLPPRFKRLMILPESRRAEKD